ncbi:MAG: S1C family serine protease [Fimbriiglobus sp.]
MMGSTMRFLLGFVLFLTSAGLHADDRPVREKVRDVERHMKSIIDDAEPSIVSIVVSQSNKYTAINPLTPWKLGAYASQPEVRNGAAFDAKLDLTDPNNAADLPFGTGVVLDIDGLILTTYHLIDGARKIYVRASNGRGSYADIHAADARSDLAVLKLQTPIEGLKRMRLANGRISTGPNGEKPTIHRGMWVVSLGHPAGSGLVDGIPAASWGILSAVRRRSIIGTDLDSRSKPLTQLSALLQTDARLTLGSSGSALLNLDGEMIGLAVPNVAVTGAETAGGFAIPMDINFRRIVDVLKQGKEVEYGFLGVSFAPTRPNQNNLLENGLVIDSVGPGTPAAEAGLQGGNRQRFAVPRGFDGTGDRIVAIDGNPLKDIDDLYLYIGAALSGNDVVMSVNRAGRVSPFTVRLTKFTHEWPYIASNRPEPVFGMRVEWSSIHQKLAGGRQLPAGVAVREIIPDSPVATKLKAFDPDLKGSWMVVAVNGDTPFKPDDFYKLCDKKTSLTLRMINLSEPDRTRTIVLP